MVTRYKINKNTNTYFDVDLDEPPGAVKTSSVELKVGDELGNKGFGVVVTLSSTEEFNFTAVFSSKGAAPQATINNITKIN